MSEHQDPKGVEKKQEEVAKATDELANEALDQVVGGAGPSAPSLPGVSKLVTPGGCKIGPMNGMFPGDKVQPPDTETH